MENTKIEKKNVNVPQINSSVPTYLRTKIHPLCRDFLEAADEHSLRDNLVTTHNQTFSEI